MNTMESGVIRERFPDHYLALWPGAIETIPFLHYHPGGRYLLLSTIGCNLSCTGCVSHILAKHPDLVSDALQKVLPGDVVRMVREHSCLGAVFCLNEPTISLKTLSRVAGALRNKGLPTGCATNGCMSRETAEILSEKIDFINFGMKGCSDDVYAACGSPCPPDSVFENMHLFHAAGVHLEVSVVYRRGYEEEVTGVAGRVRDISPDIPFHIMRFIAFEEADEDEEPSIRQAEEMHAKCSSILRWVYLFNTPGTKHLSSWCPECGSLLIDRSFNGPMGAKLTGNRSLTVCTCGAGIPVSGRIQGTYTCEPRFRGGYRTSIALDLVAGTLRRAGITDHETVSRALVRVLEGDTLEDLQVFLSSPDGYLQFLSLLSEWTGTTAWDPLISFLSKRIRTIQTLTGGREHPRVYVALSHPFLAMYPDKMECAIIPIAGGNLLNTTLEYSEKNPAPLTREAFLAMNPDIILVSAPDDDGTENFITHCQEADLMIPAVATGAVYQFPKKYRSSGPSWILALEWAARIFHPGLPLPDPEEDIRIIQSLLPGAG